MKKLLGIISLVLVSYVYSSDECQLIDAAEHCTISEQDQSFNGQEFERLCVDYRNAGGDLSTISNGYKGLLGLIIEQKYRPEKIIPKIEALLKLDINIKVPDQYGKTALHYAADSMEPIVRFLVENGVDINQGDNNGDTPLHTLVSYSSKISSKLWQEQLALLQSLGADFNKVNNAGETPLLKLIKGGYLIYLDEIEDKLYPLITSESINRPDLFGNTPLSIAIDGAKKSGSEGGHYKSVVACLLENGAKYEISDQDGNTLLHTAIGYHWHKVIDVLLEKDSSLINVPNDKGVTPALLSINNFAQGTTLKLLGRDDVDLTVSDQDGNTMMHWAVNADRIDVVEFLLEKAPNLINRANNEEKAPIMFTRDNSGDVFVSLLKNGVDLSTIYEDGNTMLHRAVKNQWNQAVTFLLESAPGLINRVNNKGRTPIMVMLKSIFWGKSIEILESFKGKGVDLSIVDGDSKTAYDYAEDSSLYRNETIKILDEILSENQDFPKVYTFFMRMPSNCCTVDVRSTQTVEEVLQQVKENIKSTKDLTIAGFYDGGKTLNLGDVTCNAPSMSFSEFIASFGLDQYNNLMIRVW